jgi:hypothetical protein
MRLISAINVFEKTAVARGRQSLPAKLKHPDWNSRLQVGDAMVRHVKQHDPLHVLLRTNRALLLTVLWAALAACIVGSLAFDVADWLSAWKHVSFGPLSAVDVWVRS